MKKITIFLTIIIVSCVQYYPHIRTSVTSYSTRTDSVTPGGIRVQLNGKSQVLLSRIDAAVAELESCLNTKIRRDAFVVIFPETYRSPCTGALLFPCDAPDSICQRKIDAGNYELLPDSPCSADDLPCPECPCDCRGAIQYGYAIITTEDMVLFKADLAAMVLGINNPWTDDRARNCI